MENDCSGLGNDANAESDAQLKADHFHNSIFCFPVCRFIHLVHLPLLRHFAHCRSLTQVSFRAYRATIAHKGKINLHADSGVSSDVLCGSDSLYMSIVWHLGAFPPKTLNRMWSGETQLTKSVKSWEIQQCVLVVICLVVEAGDFACVGNYEVVTSSKMGWIVSSRNSW